MQKIMTAMIPARLGSKRIPKKMGEKPLIQYPIDLAKSSKRFSDIWVTTESEELGKIIEKMGASFHKRSSELATDTATNREFTYDFLKAHKCDYVIMINPTSPLLRQETMNHFLDYVQEHNFDTVLSVIIEKEEIFFKGQPLNFSYDKKVNSQMLEPIETICWALTAWKRETFLKLQQENINPVFGGTIGRFSIPKDESCDLDTLEDWNIAEGILNSRMNKFEERYIEL